MEGTAGVYGRTDQHGPGPRAPPTLTITSANLGARLRCQEITDGVQATRTNISGVPNTPHVK